MIERTCAICGAGLKSQGECKSLCIECESDRRDHESPRNLLDARIKFAKSLTLKALTAHGLDAHSAWCGILLRLEAMPLSEVVAWLVSLAVPATDPTPPKIPTAMMPPGVFRKGKRFVARVRCGQTITFRRTCATAEEASAVLAEYRRGAA